MFFGNKKAESSSTKEVHANAKVNCSGRHNIGIPIIDGSTVLFKEYEDFVQSEIDRKKSFIHDITQRLPDYGRGGNATALAVEQVIAEFENGDYSKLFSTGLAAIRAAVMSFTYSGCHMLITDGIYGPVKVMFEEFITKFGVEFTYFDPLSTKEELMKLVKPNTKVIYCEVPCSRFFEVANVDIIISLAKEIKAISICDNSYFSWLNFKPLDNGFDVSVSSLTKYAAGHSDMMCGSITVKENYFNNILAGSIYMGDHFPAQSASNLLRGIRTMSLRMEKSIKSGLEFIEYLKQNKRISKIYHPTIKGHAGHENFTKHMLNSPSLLSIALDKKYSDEKMSQFFNKLNLFGMGYSYGGIESLAIPLPTTNVRLYSKNQPSNNSCIRLYIGLEDINDLIADFENALQELDS